ncbi:MAG: alpha/beta hydrolase, partial [Synechococcaceae cyanobacterium RL_1_2]|nr:alpha/beta hydrolase [Synechococcaceae cyanobacterium RL_1_2]
MVAPDLRGHGRSDHVGKGGSYNLLDFLGDIDGIISKVTDQPFTLVGHSLGSVISAIFTSIRPQLVKHLVLVETVLPPESNMDETSSQLATHLDYLTQPPEHPRVCHRGSRRRSLTSSNTGPVSWLCPATGQTH